MAFKNLILFLKCPLSTREALSNKAQELNVVGDDYYDSVLKRESLANTNMNSIFAIHHPIGLIANKTKVRVAILKQPIKWNKDSSVRIVFLLAIKNQDANNNLEHLYDIFIEIVGNSKFVNEILVAQSYEDFMNTLSHQIN